MEIPFARLRAEKRNDFRDVQLHRIPAALIWKGSAGPGKPGVFQTLFGFGDLELREWLWLIALIAVESCLLIPARR